MTEGDDPTPTPAAAESTSEARPAGGSGGRSRRRRRRGGGGQKPERRAQYWMVVTSPDNFRRTREHGFSTQGWKHQHRRRVESMKVGDRILYYVSGRMAFAATATITSPIFEDHTPLWRSPRREEDYPWRLHVRGDLVPDESGWVVAKEIAFRLEYVRRWPPEHWNLAFLGQLHQLARADFELVEGELTRLRKGRDGLANGSGDGSE